MKSTPLVRERNGRVEVRIPADVGFVRYMVERSSRKRMFEKCDAMAIRSRDRTLACTLTLRVCADDAHVKAILAITSALAARAHADERLATLLYLEALRQDLKRILGRDVTTDAFAWDHAKKLLTDRCRQHKTVRALARRLQKAAYAQRDLAPGQKPNKRSERLLEAVKNDATRIARRHATTVSMAEAAGILGSNLRRGASEAMRDLDADIADACRTNVTLDGVASLRLQMSAARCAAQTDMMLCRIHERIRVP